MKYEWKKQEKQLYLPKNKPQVVTAPKFNFFIIKGEGNPNSKEFSEVVQVLYSLSYAVKMLPKKSIQVDGYFDYTVYPLEGIWDLKEEARNLNKLDKDSLVYTLMIRQPDFLTKELAEEIIQIVKKKNPNELLDKVRFESLKEGLCVQMLHIGPYDNEPNTFAIMEDYCKQNNLKRMFKTHKEIYISDARKTEQSKLNTVLRFKVEHNTN